MNKVVKTLAPIFTAIALSCLSLNSHAGLIFESDAATGTSIRVAQYSIMTRFELSAPQTLTQIGVEMDLASVGNLNFVIFNSLTGGLLFQSGATAFADDGMQFKLSNVFSFSLVTGIRYALGAMTDVASDQNYVNGGGKTMGAISSLGQNQNANGFLSPIFNGGLAGTDGRVKLFGDIGSQNPDPDPVPVPLPATLALFGLGLVSLRWSKRKKA